MILTKLAQMTRVALKGVVVASLLSLVASAQLVRYDSQIIGPKGPTPNQNVAVCTPNANMTSQPCASLATLFSEGISAISRSAGLVTVTTSSSHGLGAGAAIVIAGVADSTYNGPANVASVLSSTQFTYLNPGSNGSSSGGTVGGQNPLTTDALGNYNFYATPGVYDVQIYGPQVATPFVLRNVTLPCVPTSATSGCGSGSSLATYTLSVSGGNITAVGGSGAATVFGTDLTPVMSSVIANMPNCGQIYFLAGTYNQNSLIQETTGGFSNYYGIGIPGNQATGQYCTWFLTGVGYPPVTGPSPLQTNGVIINLTSTAINSVPAHSKIMQLWVRPSTGSAPTGPHIYEENLDWRVPSNQRGCETQSDISLGLNASYINVTADTTVTPLSLALPVEDTCTSWGLVDSGGLIQITSNISSQNVQYFNNVNAWGGDVCIDLRSEHTVAINTYGNNCNHAINYGVTAGAGSIFHPSVLISSGWQESLRGLTIGSNVVTGAILDAWGLDAEDATFGSTFAPVYHASETIPGTIYGHMDFSAVLQNNGLIHQAGLFDGTPGSGINEQVVGYGSSQVQPSQLVVDTFHRTNQNSIGTWYSVSNPNFQITSNVAGLINGTTSARAVYTGEGFSNDQFSQMTVSTMDAGATTYAQIETNKSLSGSIAQNVYQYFCSRSAGAGQYGITKNVSGTPTSLLSNAAATCPTPPFTMELRHAGSLLCAYMNGKPDANLTPNCVQDTSLTGGNPSFFLQQDANNGIQLSNFTAGNLPPVHSPSDSVYGQPGGFNGYQEFMAGFGMGGKTTGTCTAAAAATCAITFNTAYAATPVCTATDQTNITTVKVTPSTTGLTITTAGASSDVFAYTCVGNPN